MTRGSSAAVVSGAAPLFTAVIAHLITRNEKLTPGKFLILLIGLLGISLISISAHGEGGGGKKEILGLLFLSGSVCSSALSNVLISKKKNFWDRIHLCSMPHKFSLAEQFCLQQVYVLKAFLKYRG